MGLPFKKLGPGLRVMNFCTTSVTPRSPGFKRVLQNRCFPSSLQAVSSQPGSWMPTGFHVLGLESPQFSLSPAQMPSSLGQREFQWSEWR